MRSSTYLALAFAFLSASVSADTFRTVDAIARALKFPNGETNAFEIQATVSAPPVVDLPRVAIPIADSTGCLVLRGVLRTGDVPPKGGDHIKLTGTIRCGKFRIPSANFSVQTITTGRSIPPPKQVTLTELKQGHFDWKYARLEGVVRDVLPSDTNANWIFLVLCADSDTISVAIPLNGTSLADFKSLLRKQVTVDGFCCPEDGSLRLYQGRIFQACGLSAVVVSPHEPQDPFGSADVKSLRFQHPSEIAVRGFARARGLVVCRWGRHDALLKTEDGDVIRLVCSDREPPARGTFVEAAGFPQSDLFHITLRHVIWRTAQEESIPLDPPRDVSPTALRVEMSQRAAALAELHGKTIRFTARVKSLPNPVLDDGILLVESDSWIIPVDVSSVPHAAEGIQPDACVDITATCVLSTEAWSPSLSFPQIHGFTAILNDEHDIRILARPPWWTIRRILIALGVVFSALVGLVIYGQISRARAILKKNERTRLAVELHDTLAQSLMGVSLELEAARNARGNTNAVMTEHLETASRILSSCRQELKDCLWDLRNNALDEPELSNAIRTTLQPHIDDERLSIRCNQPFGVLRDTAKHALMRIVRELVINALRHGNASHIRIAGCIERDNLLVSVTDNGYGFEPDCAPGILEGHFGLQGIRERISELHGTVTIRSSIGKGTRCRIIMPIRANS